MSETKKGTLSLSCPTDIKKNIDKPSGKVRQSFSHGKSKVVTVEVKKKRPTFGAQESSTSNKVDDYKTGDLTGDEVKTRIKAVQEAIKLEKEQSEQRIKNEQEELERVRTNSEDIKQDANFEDTELEKANIVEPETATKQDKHNVTGSVEQKYHAHKGIKRSSDSEEDEEDNTTEPRSSLSKKVPIIKKDIKELKGKYVSGAGRVSIYNAFNEESRTRSLTSIKRAKQKNKNSIQNSSETRAVIKEVILPETISVQELSSRMAIRAGEVIKTLMKLGVMATANQVIDADTAELVVMEFGHNVKRVSESDVEIGLKIEDSVTNLLPRPPVVTIMGHVDHGKTSLLDALRKTDVAIKEAGGITQCIGAYQVTMKDSRKITFIDTPGHAAFTEMRSRGANVTDIVVLVVAADDSVKDQTIEALNHAKAAGVPIIVAINKIDKNGADPEKVRKDLLNHEIIVEKFGGDIMDVEISAKNGINLDKLEEIILLQAEILDLKANPNRTAEGVVIESKVEKGQGPVATVLITKGSLHVGDIFVSGCISGRVRAIKNDQKENLKQLTPGTPGEIIGFNGTTIPGDDFIVVSDESKAKEIASYRDRKKREQAFVISSSQRTAEQMFSKIAEDEKLQLLSVIVKADVQGSSEAICSSLNKLSTEEVAVKVLHAGIGEITESDVALARASNAIIFGFNVRANAQARDQIARDKIQVKYYSIIYDLIDNIKALMSGLLTPDIQEQVIGSAEVRKTFDVSKLGRIAGCMVIDGVIKRNAKVRLIRNGIVIYTCNIKNLKRHKDDAKEVKSGFECGISLENYNDIHINDIIECFELEEVARQL